MTNIEARLRALEQQISIDADDETLPAPMEWLTLDADGDFVGPPEDADPREIRGFEIMAAMAETVPCQPEGHVDL